MRIAVIGSGVSGLSAAWLLSGHHQVVLYEKDDRLGGHANTQTVETHDGPVPVDTGFLVYNEANYANLTRLFAHLDVATVQSNMSFSASLDDGRFEYRGSPAGLFAQMSNVMRPGFWRMVRDIMRFYRTAVADAEDPCTAQMTLGDYLDAKRYSATFRDDHLLPMGAAIWSMSRGSMLDFPLSVFIRFCANHGLLKVAGRPKWRTVEGGSRVYVERLAAEVSGGVRLNTAVAGVRRTAESVLVTDRQGGVETFDAVVIATHANQALALLADPDYREQRLLSAFHHQRNFAVLHTDASLMPKRRSCWSSWNYLRDGEEGDQVCVTYWLNRLQKLPTAQDLFVTLNPVRTPETGTVIRSFNYDHPVYDRTAVAAQAKLWQLQGSRRTWFCGAYFGYGFHEDGLQAGLAVAEQLGGVRRPWTLENPSDRLILTPTSLPEVARQAAE